MRLLVPFMTPEMLVALATKGMLVQTPPQNSPSYRIDVLGLRDSKQE